MKIIEDNGNFVCIAGKVNWIDRNVKSIEQERFSVRTKNLTELPKRRSIKTLLEAYFKDEDYQKGISTLKREKAGIEDKAFDMEIGLIYELYEGRDYLSRYVFCVEKGIDIFLGFNNRHTEKSLEIENRLRQLQEEHKLILLDVSQLVETDEDIKKLINVTRMVIQQINEGQETLTVDQIRERILLELHNSKDIERIRKCG